MESFARGHGIPVHNLLPDFRGEHGPDLWVSAYDQHPNEKGHALVAAALLPFLKQLLTAAARPDPDDRELIAAAAIGRS